MMFALHDYSMVYRGNRTKDEGRKRVTMQTALKPSSLGETQAIDIRTALALGTTIVLWAAAFVAIRAALPSYPPAQLALLRFLIASLALAVNAAIIRVRLPQARDLPRIIAAGLLGITLYNLALNSGQQTVPAGTASILIQTSPIWTALVASALLGERLKLWGWIGIAVSFSGAALIVLRGGMVSLTGGAGLILVASLLLCLFTVLQKPLLARYRPVEVTTYVIWVGTFGLLPFAPSLPELILAAPLDATLAVVFLGLGPAALAYITWAMALARLPASRASAFLFFVPVTASLLAWVLLGEQPTIQAIFGGLLVIGGVVILNKFGKG
jgi:drug/metabolite transporter (DMT)-like permease